MPSMDIKLSEHMSPKYVSVVFLKNESLSKNLANNKNESIIYHFTNTFISSSFFMLFSQTVQQCLLLRTTMSLLCHDGSSSSSIQDSLPLPSKNYKSSHCIVQSSMTFPTSNNDMCIMLSVGGRKSSYQLGKNWQLHITKINPNDQ